MNKKELVNINKKNRALAKLLEDITQCQVNYDYHYERAHWVHGYDGEPGFLAEERRSGNLCIYTNTGDFIYRIYGADNGYQKNFRNFTFDEIYKEITEEHKLYPNSKGTLYVKMMLDAYLEKKTEKKAKVKV